MNPHTQPDAMPRKAILPEAVPQIVYSFDSCADASNSRLSCLPEQIESTQIEVLLHELTQAVENASCASEAELRSFVQWALEQSYSEQLNYVERMRLLELAWYVQKLLWATEES